MRIFIQIRATIRMSGACQSKLKLDTHGTRTPMYTHVCICVYETDLDTDLKYAVLEREFMIEAMTT